MDCPRLTHRGWVVALVFIVIIFFAWRADAPPAPLPVHSFECTLSITLFALLSAFSVGALWLRLYKLNDSIIHVIEWHYLPMLGIGLIGWGWGRGC